MLKKIWTELKDRVSYIIELRIYEKEKRAQDLWVVEQAELDKLLGTDYAKDIEEECKIALDLVDKDKNGTICFDEFTQ